MDSTIDGAGPRIAASATSPSSDSAGDLGRVVPRRSPQVAPAAEIEGADLSNVVPFLRRRAEADAASHAPPIATLPDRRPAPLVAGVPHWFWKALVAAVAAHAGVVVIMLLLNLQPKELPSVGQQPISVELVLGADTAEGVAPTKGPDAEQAPPPQQALDAPDEIKPDEVRPTEQQVEPPKTQPPVETAEAEPPKETPVETTEAPPETPPAAPSLPPPPVAIEMPTQTLTAEVSPAPEISPEKSNIPTMQVTPLPKPTPPVPQAKPKPRPHRVAVRGKPNNSRTTERAATASSGIGRGRSFNNANYKGLVMAHLQRYKGIANRAVTEQSQGHGAVVAFSLDGGGRVRSVSLARSSGAAALDRAIVAMVHSASPFPAPPSGQGMNFSMPVSFAMGH